MSTTELQLIDDEKVLFESAAAVLTSKRLMINRVRKGEGPEWEAFALRDIAVLKQKNGGNESRLELGLKIGAVGILSILLELLVPSIPEILDIALFLLGAFGSLGGAYMLVSTFLGVKPHTVTSIVILGEQDKVFFLPGHDNPSANAITQRFAQAKRHLTNQDIRGTVRSKPKEA